MANMYNDGRADAADGKPLRLPCDPHAWAMFKSKDEVADQKESNATYREGYADKKREMKEEAD